jgi:hypothetical protein
VVEWREGSPDISMKDYFSLYLHHNVPMENDNYNKGISPIKDEIKSIQKRNLNKNCQKIIEDNVNIKLQFP